MEMEQTECSETSAYKIHTPGNYPEESIQQQYKWLPSQYLYKEKLCTQNMTFF